jgi:molybdenum-dependent DNA-binding transcriptional regulator ModE
VNQSVDEIPEQSITHQSQELGFSYGTTWNIILHKDLQ